MSGEEEKAMVEKFKAEWNSTPWAFPHYVKLDISGEVGHFTTNGMTLRDHFAGLAMQQMLARYNAEYMASGDPEGMAEDFDTAAADAYSMADAMMSARGK